MKKIIRTTMSIEESMNKQIIEASLNRSCNCPKKKT